MPTIETARHWYPESDPVHGFDHILRVYRMAERLASAESADIEIVRAAALFHDAQGNPNQADQQEASRGEHQLQSAEIAGRVLQSEGWSVEQILAVHHCIRAHRYRDDSEQPQTLEAKVLFDADKLDATGATGVSRAIAYAAQKGLPAYSLPSQRFLQNAQLAKGETYSAYHEYLFKLCKLKDRLYTKTARQIGEQRHRYLVEFFERLASESQSAA